MTHVFPTATRRVTMLPVAAAIALLMFAVPAAAQLSTIGSALGLGSLGLIRGNDASFDPVNGRYLVVGGYGPVTGIFVNVGGTPVSGPFRISTGGHANYPRVQYSPHVGGNAGGYLVTWANEDGPGGNVNVHTRIVRADGAMLGAEQIISDNSRAWLESAPAVAYSPTSQRFLVSWATLGLAIKARAVDLNGTGVGAPVLLSTAYGRDPGVAWNPFRDEFGVSFSGEGVSGGFSVLAILSASNPDNFRRTTFNVRGGGVLTYMTDLAYSTTTRRFVMTWYEAIKALVGEFDDNGSLLRTEIVTTRVGLYDSLSIAFNPASQTFLMVGLDPQTDRLTGAELDGYGRRLGSEATFSGGSAFYARVASSLTSPHWLAMMSNRLVLTSVPVGTSTPAGTLAGGPTAPAPQPTAPAPSSCPGSVPGMTCVNGEWVPGGGGTGGGGGLSCPGSVPGMTCVNGEWVPGGGGGGNTGGGLSCPGSVPGMTCVNGEWVPGGGGTGGGGGLSCPGSVPGMTCVNGEWVPGGGGTGGGGGLSCPGSVPGMTCVNGDWVPGGGAGGGGGLSCPGSVPGMHCVNGDWVPGAGPGGGGGLSCPGSVPGMTCVNGDWVPGGGAGGNTGGCPGSVPGMTCVNGDWVPGGSLSLLPICVGGSPAPVAGWVRIGLFDWLPAEHPLATSASCRAN